MNHEYIIILLLIIIIFLLFYIVLKSTKNGEAKKNFEIEKINQNIESLLNKTLEQSGYLV